MIAVVEVFAGKLGALLLAIGGNVLLFFVVGIAVTASARKISTLLVAGGLLCAAVVLLALWGAGFDYRHLNGWALLIAFVFYAFLAFLTHIAINKRTPG